MHIHKATTKINSFRIQCKPLTHQARYALLLLLPSLLISALYNPMLHHVQNGEWITSFLLSSFGLALGVFFLHIFGRVGLFLSPFVALLLFSFTRITALYNVEPGPSFIGAILETTAEETLSMLTPMLVGAGCATIILYTLFVRWSRRFFSPWNVFFLGMFVLHLLFAQSRFATGNASRYMRSASRWSMDYICDPIKYTADFFLDDEGKSPQLLALKDPSTVFSTRDSDEPLIVVFIVGESLRADHLGINGYGRNTTPLLAKEDIINFRDVYSFAAWTREAIIGIFTDNDGTMGTLKHGSFVRLFQKHGFAVTTYNANTKPNRSDSSTAILTEGAKRFYAARPDTNLLTIFKNNYKKTPLELHIVSPYGSHFPYIEGYTEEFAQFKPDNYTRPVTLPDDLPMVINSYDNTVLYTDHVIVSFIDTIRSANSVLIYVSDHGESLGEEGRLLHGNNSALEQRRVPLFFWFSESYKQAHAERIARLREKTDLPVTQSHIFHTILEIADIKTPLTRQPLNLTQ